MSAGNQLENSPPEYQDVFIVSTRQVSLQICFEQRDERFTEYSEKQIF